VQRLSDRVRQLLDLFHDDEDLRSTIASSREFLAEEGVPIQPLPSEEFLVSMAGRKPGLLGLLEVRIGESDARLLVTRMTIDQHAALRSGDTASNPRPASPSMKDGFNNELRQLLADDALLEQRLDAARRTLAFRPFEPKTS
jgi:hypothetical protein